MRGGGGINGGLERSPCLLAEGWGERERGGTADRTLFSHRSGGSARKGPHLRTRCLWVVVIFLPPHHPPVLNGQSDAASCRCRTRSSAHLSSPPPLPCSGSSGSPSPPLKGGSRLRKENPRPHRRLRNGKTCRRSHSLCSTPVCVPFIAAVGSPPTPPGEPGLGDAEEITSPSYHGNGERFRRYREEFSLAHPLPAVAVCARLVEPAGRGSPTPPPPFLHLRHCSPAILNSVVRGILWSVCFLPHE